MENDLLVSKLLDLNECLAMTVEEVLAAMGELGTSIHSTTITDDDDEPILVFSMATGEGAKRLLEKMAEDQE